MFGFAIRTIIAITVGLLLLIAVSMAFAADVFATESMARREAVARRQKPTPRARNRVQWARS